jgi:glyoxylate reductase
VNTRPAILVTRRLPASAVDRLDAVGAVDRYEDDGAMSPSALVARLAGKAAVVATLTETFDRPLLARTPELRLIANVAVGFNNIDVAAAVERGVIVTNTPDVLTDSTADFTWGLILAITRRIAEGDRLVRAGGWKGWAFDFMLGTELKGKQLGIVGMGRIGRAVAARAAVFGMRVAYHSRRAVEADGAEAMSLDRLLVSSDVVSLHVPLAEDTRHLIDKKALARMRRSAYLINTTRGPVVDEAALAWALRERLIAGAALDVYEREPEVHADLLGIEHVVLAPHLGSATTETRLAMANLAVDNVIAVLSGRPAVTPVALGGTRG